MFTIRDFAFSILHKRATATDGTGGYTGKKVEYDVLDRAFRETIPTEMNSSWNPAGDDYRSNTWLWNTREFDPKGRFARFHPTRPAPTASTP